MDSSSFGVSHSDLQHIAVQLTETATWLPSGTVLAGAPGAEPYAEITSAVGEFDEGWDHTMRQLRDATAELGDKVAAVSRLVDEHDAQAAESIRALTSLLPTLPVEPVGA